MAARNDGSAGTRVGVQQPAVSPPSLAVAGVAVLGGGDGPAVPGQTVVTAGGRNERKGH